MSFNARPAQLFDVQPPPRPEVREPFLQLSRPRAVRAPPVRLAGDPDHLVLARRAFAGELERLAVGRALARDDLDDVGDDVPGALDQPRIADPDVLAPNLVLVVEADVADGDA